MKVPQAKDLFEAQVNWNREDSIMTEFIFRNFGWVVEDPNSSPPFDDITFDDYDCSVELIHAHDDWEPTTEQMKVMFDQCGFDKVYVNYNDGREVLWEKGLIGFSKQLLKGRGGTYDGRTETVNG